MSLANQPTRQDDYGQFFAELESRLSAISHSDEAVNVIESAVSERFKKTAHRQIAFAQPGSICLESPSRMKMRYKTDGSQLTKTGSSFFKAM